MRHAAPPMFSLTLSSGTCFALFAYDVGLSIDLDEADRRIRALKERATLRHKRRAPRYFDYRPPPLRVLQEGACVSVGRFVTRSQIEAVLYDFGAVSVTYSVTLCGPIEDLTGLSEGLYDNRDLLDDSRRRVEDLLAALGPAVQKAQIAEFAEGYAIFEVPAFDPPCAPAELLVSHAQTLARILRSEREELSADEVADALANHISFGVNDVAIIDWDGAFVMGREMEDVRAVLEFANVELLEMRSLDQRLDGALDEAYEAMSRRRWRHPLRPGSRRAELHHIAQMQVDGAILFEGVNNALKLVGDQYLARVYRLVSQRFHLAEWDASILRKLETLESIYQKMSDLGTSRRMEILEWIIILLIAVSIVIPFLPNMGWYGGH
jgi:hypothetical protein